VTPGLHLLVSHGHVPADADAQPAAAVDPTFKMGMWALFIGTGHFNCMQAYSLRRLTVLYISRSTTGEVRSKGGIK
jgi:hypothetical protein